MSAEAACRSQRVAFTWVAMFGEFILVALRAAANVARRTYARYRRHRKAWAAYEALRRLDDRTLRDLGFSRSELSSVAAEFAGDAENKRVRALEQTATRKIFHR